MTVPDDTGPTSTIDHIESDDVVEVDQPQPTGPEACFDIGLGDGVGQSQWTLSPCTLPTTTEVAAGPPPLPPGLPVTGGGATTMMVAVIFGALGGFLMSTRRRR